MRGVAFSMALPALLLAGWFAINATDEDLSADAKALMDVPRSPSPSQENGYLDFLALGAPEGVTVREFALRELRVLNTPQAERAPGALGEHPGVEIDKALPECQPAQSSCLEAAHMHPLLKEIIDRHAVFLARYRAMRAKPQFIDLTAFASPDGEFPSYRDLFQGQRLSLLRAAAQFNAGDRARALDELEKENAFHRRMAVGARSLLVKMLSYAALERDALFAAELARNTPPNADAAYWQRLEAVVRPPTHSEVDVTPSLREEFAARMRWMSTRRYVRLSDSYYALAKTMPEFGIGTRPWWDRVAPYLYRPNHSLNLFAAQEKIWLSVGERPGPEYEAAREEASKRVAALAPSLLEALVVNPVGRIHPYLAAEPLDYFCRMHAHAGVLSLVHLQVELRAAEISEAEAAVAALSGPLGRAHADPFTGEPMRFDRKTGTIGFNVAPKCISGASRPLLYRYGRMAVPL